VSSGRRLGVATMTVGLLIAAAAQTIAPLSGPPVYDGVLPVEPYRWLSPPPGHPGGAEGATATVGVRNGRNELLAVATPELSPQAQVFGVPGSLTLPAGATTIKVSIAPVPTPAKPSDGYVDGNVYHILLTDQTGAPVTADASQRVSVVLRPADPTLLDGTIERFDGSGWRRLTTQPPVGGGGLLAIVTEFGDYAVVGHGTSPYPTSSPVAASSPALGSSPSAGRSASATASETKGEHVPTKVPGGGAAANSGTAEPPWAAIGAVVALLAGAALVAVVLRRRRRRRVYRGARPVTRR
jgi:hypothetical protein